MIQKQFLNLDRSADEPFRIEESTQIEPLSAEDPDELYRMRWQQPSGRDLRFDVVFYPNRADILHTDEHIRIGEVRAKDEVKQTLDRLKPHIPSV